MDEKILRYKIQCTEFLDSYDPSDLLNFMEENSIAMEDMSLAISRFALNSDRVFDRIEGKEIDNLFIVPSNEVIEKSRKPSEVCFIVCSDDALEYSRIMEWVNNLYVPQNITLNSMQVTGVSKLPSGYNEAMEASDAKYKIYVRDGVRILNPYFLYNIIDIFETKTDVAMIGFLGSKYIPSGGIMEDVDCYGSLAVAGENETFVCGENPISDVYASFVHSCVVATCNDIKWNADTEYSDEFTCSVHAIEYKKKGLKTLIPPQEYPWVLYDYGKDVFSHDSAAGLSLIKNIFFEPDKKHVLLCLGANSLVEMPNNGLDKLASNLEIFDNSIDKIQLFITFFPEDIKQWIHVNSDAFSKIDDILFKRNVITGPMDKDFLDMIDAYYGDSSPLVLKLVDMKKPVMIRSAAI